MGYDTVMVNVVWCADMKLEFVFIVFLMSPDRPVVELAPCSPWDPDLDDPIGPHVYGSVIPAPPHNPLVPYDEAIVIGSRPRQGVDKNRRCQVP